MFEGLVDSTDIDKFNTKLYWKKSGQNYTQEKEKNFMSGF